MENKDPIDTIEIDMDQPDPHPRTFSDKFWHDKDGNFAVIQRPNRLIIIWFVTFMISELFHEKYIRLPFGWFAFVILVIWSLSEAFSGVNYFRRSLGVLVFAVAVLTRF